MRDNYDESEELNQVRTRQPNRKYKGFYQYNGENANKDQESYTSDEAYALSNIIKHYAMIKEYNYGNSYAQTYSLSNGLKKFKEKGKQAATAEIEQLHNREAFEPIHPKDITQLERNKAMNSLIFLTEKKDGTIKARACANGSIQRRFIAKQEAASPTVTTEALLTSCVMDAKQILT